MAITLDQVAPPGAPRTPVPGDRRDGGPPPDARRRASRRVRRNRWLWAAGLVSLVILVVALFSGGGGHAAGPAHTPRAHGPAVTSGDPRLEAEWEGDGQAVTFAFGGDVHFPSGTNLGDRLAADPTTALGPTVPALLSGADLTMVNFESAMTDGTCPDPQPKEYDFFAPSTALDAFRGAGITLVTETNNHGLDCGLPGLQQALSARSAAGYPVLGIGQDASQAFTPYETTIHGQRIAIVAATQVIDSDLQSAWTATSTQPGLASAYDVSDLLATVEAVRRVSDTVIVYLHWGTELDACPNPLQEPLAKALVAAGADIVVGTHAHVLLGGGYLGSAYVDYGLGNFAFYDNSPPEDASGSLVITATGRRIDAVDWRPALIQDDLPQPLTGSAAAAATAAWDSARSCTDVTATPTTPQSSPTSERTPATPAQIGQLGTDG